MSKLRFVNSLTFSKDMKYMAELGYDPYNSLDCLEQVLSEESDFLDRTESYDDNFLEPLDNDPTDESLWEGA